MTMPIDIDETVFSEHPKLKTGTKLGMLKGSPTYEAEKNLVQAFRDAVDNNLNNEREISLATYQWMSEGDENNPVVATSLVKHIGSQANEGEDVLDVWNTFTDAIISGGLQLLYDFREVAISDDIEIPDFPKNFPPLTGGFYDITVTPTTIKYVLKDNRSASNLVFPDGTYDKYYFIFPEIVESVSVISSDNLVPTASIVSPGTEEVVIDAFHTGLTFPPVLDSNVLEVIIGPGSDLTELGQVIEIEYSLEKSLSSRYICGSSPLIECSFPMILKTE